MSTALDVEAGPAAVGTLVGAAGLLFLAEPVAGPVNVGGLRVRPVALSAVSLTAGFGLGAVVFYRRGRRFAAIGHGLFGIAWAGIVAATAAGSGRLLLGSILFLLGGCGFLATRARSTFLEEF